jgi:hypothetical protein
MIDWALKEFNLDDEYIWCSAFSNERDIYLDHGWKEIAFVDIDLSEFKGKFRGYGVIRVYGMLRKPSGLEVDKNHQ